MANEDFVLLYFSAAQISARLSAMHNGRGAFSRSPLVASRARILPYWCNAIELPSLHNRTSSADALRLCKPSVFISRPAISSRAFRLSSPGSPFLLLFFLFFILFFLFPFLSRFDPRTRSVDRLQFRNSIGRLKASAFRFTLSRDLAEGVCSGITNV